MRELQEIYEILFANYGPQGWWPLSDIQGINPTKTGSGNGYHVGEYDFPKTKNQQFEICCGAILTQNTNWVNVEKALNNLNTLNALHPKKLLQLDDQTLKNAIKPAGYFNQKARKLKEFTHFFLSLNKTPTREELLAIWGIGPETADSILLYAYTIPTFIVDAYTKRICVHLGFISETASYGEVKALFEKNLKPNVIVYQEYHALLVEHAKRYYAKKGNYCACPLYKKYKDKNRVN